MNGVNLKFDFQKTFHDASKCVGNFVNATFSTMFDVPAGGPSKFAKLVADTIKLVKTIFGALSTGWTNLSSNSSLFAKFISPIELLSLGKVVTEQSIDLAKNGFGNNHVTRGRKATELVSNISGLALSVIGVGQFFFNDMKLFGVRSLFGGLGNIPFFGLILNTSLGVVSSSADIAAKSLKLREINGHGQLSAEIGVCAKVKKLWKIKQEIIEKHQFNGQDFANHYFNAERQAHYDQQRAQIVQLAVNARIVADHARVADLARLAGDPAPALPVVPALNAEQRAFNKLYADPANKSGIDALIAGSAAENLDYINQTFTNAPTARERADNATMAVQAELAAARKEASDNPSEAALAAVKQAEAKLIPARDVVHELDSLKKTVAYESKKWEVLTLNNKVALAQPKWAIAASATKLALTIIGAVAAIITGYVWIPFVLAALGFVVSALAVSKVFIGKYNRTTPEFDKEPAYMRRYYAGLARNGAAVAA